MAMNMAAGWVARSGLALLLALACWTVLPAWGQQPQPAGLPAGVPSGPQEGRRVALVVGNGAYRFAPSLTNPTNDAKAIAQALRTAGFELIGGDALLDLDKAGVEQAIRKFGAKLVGADVGLFYYAGHGLQVKGTNYLVPTSANLTKEADVKYELVDVNMVLDEMGLAESRLNIVILDACRNNPFGGRGFRSANAGLAQMQAPAGTLIAYATQPGAVAADGEGANSPYTEALTKALAKPGETVFDVFNDVGVAVKKTTGGSQQPWVSTSPIEGRFYFLGPTSVTVTPAPAPAAPPAAAPGAAPGADKETVFWDSVRNSNNPRLFEAYLQQFPQGTFVALAQVKLAELNAGSAPAAPAAPAVTTPAPAQISGQIPAPAAPEPTVQAPAVAIPPAIASSVASVMARLAVPPAPPAVPPAPPAARPFEVSSVPFLSSKAKQSVGRYADLPGPKALAISQHGHYAYFSSKSSPRTEEDARRNALEYCQYLAKSPCMIYALGDAVVADPKGRFAATPVEIQGSGRFDPTRVPFVSSRTREVGMSNYAKNPGSKAVALTPTGQWATSWGKASVEDARDAALERCEERNGKGECMIFAVDETVVFDDEQ